MRKEFAEHGPDVVLSCELADALDDRLTRHEQALVLLNRRGFATAVFCRQCARSLECPNCSVSLTFHRSVGRAQCHYCGYARARPTVCPECAGPYLEQIGFGTERVEAEIRDRWPSARVARLDRDTVRRQGAAARLLGRFAEGEVDVLVGTQMVAKGHDFPNVTLVGVVSADVGLGVADFRAAERTFQLLTQVAGRAGRGKGPGRGGGADALPRPLQHPPRMQPGLRAVLRRGDPLSSSHAVSTDGRAGERRGPGDQLPTDDAGGGRSGGLRAAAPQRVPRARTGACADRAAPGAVSGAAVPEGPPAPGNGGRRCSRRWTAAPS